MLQIKGSVIKGAIENTKKSIGESEYNRIVKLLNKEAEKLLLSPISSSGWYSLDVYISFLDMLVREKLGGNPHGLIKPTEEVIEEQLKGIYSVFVTKGSPESLLKKMATVNATYLNGVTIEASVVDEGKGKIRYTGLEKQHAVFEYVLIGFYRKAAQMYGAKNVKVEVTTGIAEGKGYSEFAIAWNDD
jgi:hypothetical protein